jgi:hypothetical protein
VKLFEQCGKLSLCLDVTDDLTNNPVNVITFAVII